MTPLTIKESMHKFSTKKMTLKLSMLMVKILTAHHSNTNTLNKKSISITAHKLKWAIKACKGFLLEEERYLHKLKQL